MTFNFDQQRNEVMTKIQATDASSGSALDKTDPGMSRGMPWRSKYIAFYFFTLTHLHNEAGVLLLILHYWPSAASTASVSLYYAACGHTVLLIPIVVKLLFTKINHTLYTM